MRYHIQFGPTPAPRAQTATAQDAVRHQLAVILRQDLDETEILNHVREELLARYVGRGYRGPIPPLMW